MAVYGAVDGCLYPGRVVVGTGEGGACCDDATGGCAPYCWYEEVVAAGTGEGGACCGGTIVG